MRAAVVVPNTTPPRHYYYNSHSAPSAEEKKLAAHPFYTTPSSQTTFPVDNLTSLQSLLYSTLNISESVFRGLSAAIHSHDRDLGEAYDAYAKGRKSMQQLSAKAVRSGSYIERRILTSFTLPTSSLTSYCRPTSAANTQKSRRL